MEELRPRQWPLYAGLGALIFMLLAVAWTNREQLSAQRAVRHSFTVEKTIQVFWSDALDADDNGHDYLLFYQPQMRQKFNAAAKRATDAASRLERLTRNSPVQHQRARRLNQLILESLSKAQSIVDAGARKSPQDIRVTLLSGAEALDRIRGILDEMALEEQNRLRHEQRRSRTAVLSTVILLGFLSATIIVLAFFVSRRLSGQVSQLRENFRLLKAEARAREKAEAELRQVQKMESIGQLAGGIAHDFNNMLAVIMNALQLARRRLPSDPSRAQVNIDQALEGARRAAQLTSKLLAFSRRQPLHPELLDLRRSLVDITEMLQRMLGSDFRIEARTCADLWPVFLDSIQLENAILNLTINARDAMPNGGAITIAARNVSIDAAGTTPDIPEGHYVLISVTDMGGGIDEAILHRIVEPFYTTKEVGKGTGLGLSQVDGFVSQSQGHLRISSRPGKGTQVEMYFPAHLVKTCGKPQASA